MMLLPSEGSTRRVMNKHDILDGHILEAWEDG